MVNSNQSFSLTEFTRFAENISAAVTAVGNSQFLPLLVQALTDSVPSDDLTIILFDDVPEILLHKQENETFSEDIQMYIDGAYLLDPYYRAGRDNTHSGFAHYVDLAPEGYTQSSYYQQYLVKTNLIDECGYLIQLPDNTFINIALDRSNQYSPFSQIELMLLEAMTPLIESLCLAHWSTQLREKNAEDRQLNRQLDEALTQFASTKLTPRECEVVRLILQGHSSNSVAEQLGISPETVRIHRRNGYKKLDVGSQSELFHLFISSLKRFDVYTGGDPLEGYF